MNNNALLVLGQVLMLCGLVVPIVGLVIAFTASSSESDMDVIGFEALALMVGYLVFLVGRWVAAKGQEST